MKAQITLVDAADAADAAGTERLRALKERCSERAACDGQVRLLNRQLSLLITSGKPRKAAFRLLEVNARVRTVASFGRDGVAPGTDLRICPETPDIRCYRAPIRFGNRSSIRVPCIMYSDHSRLSYDH